MTKEQKDNNCITKIRIKSLLRENGMYQQTLADEIPLTAQYFSAMINGNRPFQVSVAKRIAEIFSPVRYEWIMGYDDFKTEDDLIKHTEAEAADKVYLAIEDLINGLGFDLHSGGEYSHGDIMKLFEEIEDIAEFKTKKLIERSVTDG